MNREYARLLNEQNLKIVKWTYKAEQASTKEEVLRALRKIAKHSLKLAELQGRRHTETVQED